MEQRINKTKERPPYQTNDNIRQLHAQLTIVDLHGDSLLWNRDLLKRSSHGHIDLPRLTEGNVAIQVFGVVTQFPFFINFKKNYQKIDLITLLAMVDHWPRQTRKNLFQRAIYQANKLKALIERAAGKIMLIESVKDLDRLLEVRRNKHRIVGAMLSLEGAHALNGDLSNLKILHDLSFRIIGLAHFIDNDAGGSAHGQNRGGLSSFGIELLELAQALHMIIDLSHAAPRVVNEAMEITSTPVIASHTGACGICPNSRNLTDEQIKKIANHGGVIGIAMFKEATCGDRIDDVARTMRYVTDLVGVDHVSLGSDFDGAITAPIDVSGLPLLTEKLLNYGFTEDQIFKIMGANALRLFRETLPQA